MRRQGIDARALGTAIAAVNEVLHLHELDAGAAGALARAVGASGLLVYRFDEQGRVGGVAGCLQQAVSNYSLDLFLEDPVQHGLLAAADLPRVVDTNSHLGLDDRRFRRSAAYADFYRPYEMERLLGMRLFGGRYGSPGMIGILLTRSQREAEFSAEERALVEQALPAFEAAARRASRAAASEAQREALSAVLCRGAGVHHLILDARGRLLWISPEAEARLVVGASGALPEALTLAARRLAGLAPDQAPDESAYRVRVDASDGPTMADLAVTRTASGAPVIAVTLAAPRGLGAPKSTALAARYHLTRAESEVLAILAGGASNRDIAARLHVSIETVKTHVQRILGKLGVESRVQAALAARAPTLRDV